MASRYKREGRLQRGQAATSTTDFTEQLSQSSSLRHSKVVKEADPSALKSPMITDDTVGTGVDESKHFTNEVLLQKLIQIENALTFYFSRGRLAGRKRVIDLLVLFRRYFDEADGDCQERLLAIMIVVAPNLYVFEEVKCRLHVPNGGSRVTLLRECWKRYTSTLNHESIWNSSHSGIIATKEHEIRAALLNRKLPLNNSSEKRRSSRLLAQDDARNSDQLDENDNKKARLALSEQFVHEGMNLEERVHARAKASSMRASKDSGRIFTDSNEENSSPLQNSNLGNSDLLQVADALRSFLRSNSHAGKTRSAIKVTEIVNRLRGATYGIKSGGQRVRSRVILQKLLDLVKAVPNWIRIETQVDGKTTTWEGGRNWNEAILRINSKVDYANMVRVALGGRSKYDFFPVQSSPERKRQSSNEDNDIRGVQASQSSPTKKRALSNLPTKVSETALPSRMIENSNTSNLERENEGRRDKVIQQKKKVYRMQKLRINHDLIFGHRYDNDPMPGDPDFISGHLKISEIGDCRSPNGLKRLFSEMNCGRRI